MKNARFFRDILTKQFVTMNLSGWFGFIRNKILDADSHFKEEVQVDYSYGIY
jgi:hypothetical protein